LEAGAGLKPKTGIEKLCEVCNKSFYVPKNRQKARFCSTDCHRVAQVTRRETICATCGETFLSAPSRGMQYCTRECYEAARYKRPLEHQVNGKPAKVNKQGYVEVWDGEKWVFEHRFVMERELGRPLLMEEHVHHINRVKDDNRPENLKILSGSEHATLTNAEIKADLAELERYREQYGPLDD